MWFYSHFGRRSFVFKKVFCTIQITPILKMKNVGTCTIPKTMEL